MAESDFSIEIDKNAVSETKSFSNPPPALKQVFTATALLLGHPEKHAQDWKFLKSLLTPYGDKSLQNQLNNIDVTKISETVAMKARDIIDLVDVDMLRCISSLAYDMYRWNDNVISAVLESTENKTS